MSQTSIQVRVAFFDVDSTQRIHFTAMFRYMELAEHALMRSIGFPYASTLLDIAFPRVHLACDFSGAIRYDDLLTIEARVDHVGRSSWNVAFMVLATPTKDGQEVMPILAQGQMTMVAMDPETQRARPLPEELSKALLRTER